MLRELIVIFPFFFIAANIFAQQSLTSIIEEISATHNVEFAYPTELLETQYVNELEIDKNLEKQLDLIFEDLPIEYKIFNSTKVLLRKETSNSAPVSKPIILSGTIFDQENSLALISATIYLEDFKKGCYTNDKGEYELMIDEADLQKNVIISYLGYEEKKISVKQLIDQSKIHLKLAELEFETIVISHVNPTVLNKKDGSYQFKKESLSENNAGLSSSDLFRSIQMMSGVSATRDDESSIKIRNSNSEQTLIILDEMPIYNSSHYYGIFSNINKNYIDQVRLYKNILPIEYAGFAAGMLKMESHKLEEKTTGIIDFNLIAPSINFKLPVDSSFQIQFAGRRSLLDLESIINDPEMDQVFNFLSDNLQRKAIDRVKPTFNFYDLNAQIQYRFKNNSSISANYFNSNDDFLLAYENDFKTKKNGEENQLKENYLETRNWSNQTASIIFETPFSKSLNFKFIALSSEYNHNNDVESFFKNQNNNNELNRDVTLENRIKERGVKAMLSKVILNSTFQLGLEYNSFNVSQLINRGSNDNIENDNAQRISLFSSYKFDKNNWFFELGTRVNNYMFKNKTNYSLSPQAYIRYKPTESIYLKASIGRNVQYLRLINYRRNDGNSIELYRLANNLGINDNSSGIPPIYSNNYMFGFNKNIDKWNFDIELYKKDITGSIEFASRLLGFEGDINSAPKIDDFKLYRGDTKVKGMDLGISYTSNNYNSLVSYTLSKADNFFPDIFNNSLFPNENDQRHELNWTNSLQLKQFIFSANYVYGSGKPYLDLEGLETLVDRESTNPESLYTQLDYYSRIDVGLAYNIPFKNSNASIGLSVLNLLDRENVKYRQQTFSIAFDGNDQNDNRNAVIGSESALLSRTFNLSLNYSW